MNSSVSQNSGAAPHRHSGWHDFSGPFGNGAFFDVGIPSGQFDSPDRVLQLGWHRVNDSYLISRPQGLPVHLMILTVAGEGSVSVGNSTFQARPGTSVWKKAAGRSSRPLPTPRRCFTTGGARGTESPFTATTGSSLCGCSSQEG